MENKNMKPKGKVILRLLSFIALIAGAFAIFTVWKLRSMGGQVPKYIYLAIFLIVVFYLLILFFVCKKLKKQKNTGKNIRKKALYIALVMYILICASAYFVTRFVYNYAGNFNKEYIEYSSSLITLKEKKCEKVSDVNDYIIGMLSNKESEDGYIIPRKMIKKYKLEDENEIKEYDSYQEMMSELLSNKIDALFIPTDYAPIFNGIEGYENITDKTKKIVTKKQKFKKSTTSKREVSSRGKSVKNPFTILLLGVDSNKEGLDKNTVANGDSLILITFNPKTLNATMLSIPRDSYVPIACWSGKPENKITHAAAYGTDCMMSTIENYFDVKIDYYAKINFKGMVQLVNALGGIDVDVPKELCTDDSNRSGEVCIKAGHQHLDGEGALVLSRNRKQLANGDLGRGENQQIVIKAMIDKIKSIKSASQFLKVLDTISNNFDSNFTNDQILSFYSIAEDLMNNDLATNKTDLVNIQQLYLLGSGQMIYDERAKMVLWDYIPNEASRKDIIKAMKTNLGLVDHDVVKEFSFSIDEEYEKKVIGKGPYNSGSNYKLVPDFTGKTKEQAQALANQYGIKVTFEGASGTVISQSMPANKRVDKTGGSITLTLSKKTAEVEQKKEEKKEDTATNKEKEKDKETEPAKDKETENDKDKDKEQSQSGNQGETTEEKKD